MSLTLKPNQLGTGGPKSRSISHAAIRTTIQTSWRVLASLRFVTRRHARKVVASPEPRCVLSMTSDLVAVAGHVIGASAPDMLALDDTVSSELSRSVKSDLTTLRVERGFPLNISRHPSANSNHSHVIRIDGTIV